MPKRKSPTGGSLGSKGRVSRTGQPSAVAELRAIRASLLKEAGGSVRVLMARAERKAKKVAPRSPRSRVTVARPRGAGASERVHQAFRFAAGQRGYTVKGNTHWKTHSEVTTLLHLQRSRFDKGIYVNIGAIPNAFVKGSKPPRCESCPFYSRVTMLRSNNRTHIFKALQSDARRVDARDLENAAQWIFAWLENRFRDGHKVRLRVLREKDDGMIDIWRDWALGRLRPVRQYYTNDPYFKT